MSDNNNVIPFGSRSKDRLMTERVENPSGVSAQPIALTGMHRFKGEPTEEEGATLTVAPIQPHRFLDKDEVMRQIFQLPPYVRLGREIYLGALEKYEDAPWQLIIDIDCVRMEAREGGFITTTYDLAITTLDRMAYGDFFAGNLYDDDQNLGFRHEFAMTEIMDSWEKCKQVFEAEEKSKMELTEFVRSCDPVVMRKGSRNLHRKYGNPIGKEFLARDKGDIPLLITGFSLGPDCVTDRPNWKLDYYCHYWREGYATGFSLPYVYLTEAPRPAQNPVVAAPVQTSGLK